MTARPLLIVNADDFGLTQGVCDGILRAGDRGIVTSTSALVNAPAFAANAASLRDSGLGVGGHMCLVGEDPPVLAAGEVPTLVDATGRFRVSWRQVVRDAALGRIDPADVRREFAAQLDVMAASGLKLTHLDSHQNLHLWPLVARVIVGLAADYEIGAIRLTRSAGRTPRSVGVRSLAAALAARADRAGLLYPQASSGLDDAGSLDVDGVCRHIEQFAAAGVSSAELATHPGADPDPERERYRWGYRWAQELDALCADSTKRAIEAAGFRLGTFGDFAGPPPANAATRRVLASYRERGLRPRVHTHLRWHTAPLCAVEDLVVDRGDVLDVGCGHGAFALYLAVRSEARSVRGVDVDADKVAIARMAAERLGLSHRVTFEVVGPAWTPDAATTDAVVVNDVLYLMGSPRAEQLLVSLARALRPGGSIVVKEIDDSPSWKARVSAGQELLATEVFRITAGEVVEFVHPEVIERCMRSAGLAVTKFRLDRGYPHPHAAWVGRAPDPTESTA